MRRLSLVIRLAVGFLLGLVLSTGLAMRLPAVQQRMGGELARLLEDKLHTKVSLGRVEAAINGRMVVHDLYVQDRQGDTLLTASRVGVRLSLWALLNGRVRIGNAQLFGLNARLSQTRADTATNFQFVLDAFASRDTTPSTLDLRIGQLLIRRAHVRFDRQWIPASPGRFNPAHIALNSLNATVELEALRPDTFHAELKRLDFFLGEGKGKQTTADSTGFRLNSAQALLTGNRKELTLSEAELTLPHSTLTIPTLRLSREADANGLPRHADVDLYGTVRLADLRHFLPDLKRFPLTLNPQLRARLDEGTLSMRKLRIDEASGIATLALTGSVNHLGEGKEKLAAQADLHQLLVDAHALAPLFRLPALEQLGTTEISGPVYYNGREAGGRLSLHTARGRIQLNGSRQHTGRTDITLQAEDIALKELLHGTANVPIELLSLTAHAKGDPQKDISLEAEIPFLKSGTTAFHNIRLKAQRNQAEDISAHIEVDDDHLLASLQAVVNPQRHMLRMQGELQRLAPHALGVRLGQAGDILSAQLNADIQGTTWDNPEGFVHLDDLRIWGPDSVLNVGDIHLSSFPDNGGRHLRLTSPFLEAQADGKFRFQALRDNVAAILHTYIPTIKAPASKHADDFAQVQLRLHDARPLNRLFSLPLSIQGTTQLALRMDAANSMLNLHVDAPAVDYGSERLRHVNVRLETAQNALHNTLSLTRMLKNSNMDIRLETNNVGEQLHNHLQWDNNRQPAVKGDINMVADFYNDRHGQAALRGRILPSDIVIADSLWHLHPGAFCYEEGKVRVDSFHVGRMGHSIQVSGVAGKEPTDTLRAQLKRIKLEYIFSLINFDAVELAGEASGRILATQLMGAPKADAFLQIPHFSINNGEMGLLDIYGNWGRRPYSIFLDGILTDFENNASGIVSGYITPKKDVSHHGLDLDIRSNRLNMFFLNKFTKAVLDNLQGRASGHARLFGPFKQLNIEGDVVVDEAAFGIPYTGVRYHLQNDSVQLRPDNIIFKNATLYDPLGGPSTAGHRARIDGHLIHRNFSNLSYDIQVEGQNILGYDFKEPPPGMNFFGTVFADGKVRILGKPGKVGIDINARPLRGTTFTYNMTAPDHLRESDFVSYVSHPDSLLPALPADDSTDTDTKQPVQPPIAESSELTINFDLDITPDTRMNLLMDTRAGDRISVDGSGRMRARYYNKEGFQLYGSYVINSGSYNLTLQNFIRKDFTIAPGGRITFAGNPMQGQLDVTAVHTVTGVSLNDLSARATFSSTSARVNCLMNITGQANQPQIAFDLDIPNVNEDEKRMIRSLISTEEERNMQVIYLLGIGRFYTYNYENTQQTQSYTAMNSLLSSTLSGQLNQIFQNMIGRSNWNVGANLNTGEQGWSDLDVEGAIQGSLLNNRLLINGNFGYRDNSFNQQQSNFVGDFDVQYKLTPSGNVNLKAYSETNDRYFTKSSLTTQGVGLQLKKEFSNLRDLFRVRRQNKRKNKQ